MGQQIISIQLNIQLAMYDLQSKSGSENHVCEWEY